MKPYYNTKQNINRIEIKTIYGEKISGINSSKTFAMKTIRNTFYRKKSKFKRIFTDSYIFTKTIGMGHYKVIEGLGPNKIELKDLKKGDYIVIKIKKEIIDIKEIYLSDYINNYFLDGEKIKCNDSFYSLEDYNKVMEEYKEEPIKGKKSLLSKKYNIPNSTISNWTNGKQKPRIDIHIINNKIKIDNNFMRLLGYYIAEGSGVSDHQIRFSFNSNEVEYINDTKYLVEKIFGIKPNKNVIIGNETNAAASSRLLKEFFRNMVGNDALKKKVPEWVLYLPLDKQKELVNGYWRGDGCKSDYGFQFDTASIILAKQIRQILQRLGFLPSFRTVIKNRKNPKYVIEIFGEKINEFCNIVGENHPIIFKRTKTYNNGWNDGNYIFLPIRKIEVIN